MNAGEAKNFVEPGVDGLRGKKLSYLGTARCGLPNVALVSQAKAGRPRDGECSLSVSVLGENLNMLPAQEAYLQDQALMTMTVSSRRSSLFDRENLNPLMESRPKRVFGPLASFLNSRIGSRWAQVLVELSERLETEDRFRAVLPSLGELVEFRAVRRDGNLCYGSGLLMGQPLMAGWRRRLYVCPESGRLLRMPLETGALAGGYEKCVM